MTFQLVSKYAFVENSMLRFPERSSGDMFFICNCSFTQEGLSNFMTKTGLCRGASDVTWQQCGVALREVRAERQLLRVASSTTTAAAVVVVTMSAPSTSALRQSRRLRQHVILSILLHSLFLSKSTAHTDTTENIHTGCRKEKWQEYIRNRVCVSA